MRLEDPIKLGSTNQFNRSNKILKVNTPFRKTQNQILRQHHGVVINSIPTSRRSAKWPLTQRSQKGKLTYQVAISNETVNIYFVSNRRCSDSNPLYPKQVDIVFYTSKKEKQL